VTLGQQAAPSAVAKPPVVVVTPDGAAVMPDEAESVLRLALAACGEEAASL